MRFACLHRYPILAFDQSFSHFSYCFLKKNIAKVESIRYDVGVQGWTGTRLLSLYDWFTKIILESEVNLVVLEQAYIHRNTINSSKLIEVAGVLKLAIEKSMNSGLEVSPKTHKLKLVGKGDATKKETMLEVQRRFKVKVNNDEADAISLALYGDFYLRKAIQNESK